MASGTGGGRDWHEHNREAWNAFLERGRLRRVDTLPATEASLQPEDLELLGEVEGTRVAHLQCSTGGDTIALARRGAIVTAVDISDEAIATARARAAEAGVAATFERADVLDWLEAAPERFDVVFTSGGVVTWLSDLGRWARGIARVLRPGGRVVLVEFHPVLWMLDADWRPTLPYSSAGEPRTRTDVLEYMGNFERGAAATGAGASDGLRLHEFAWSLADVVEALLGAGLTLRTLREWPYTNDWAPLPGMRRDEQGRCWPPDGMPFVPLMYGLAAEKAEEVSER